MQLRYKKGDILSVTEDVPNALAVTILSDTGTPMFCVLQYGGAIYLKTSEEDDFQETLDSLNFI